MAEAAAEADGFAEHEILAQRCTAAAKAGDIAQLEILVQRHHTAAYWHDFIVVCGNVTTLEWCRRRWPDIWQICGNMVAIFAARNGWLPVLEWLVRNFPEKMRRVTRWADLAGAAVVNNRVAVLNWLVEHAMWKDEIAGNMYLHAAENNCVDVLDWLWRTGVLPSDTSRFSTVLTAERCGHLAVLEWLDQRYLVDNSARLLSLTLRAATMPPKVLEWALAGDLTIETCRGARVFAKMPSHLPALRRLWELGATAEDLRVGNDRLARLAAKSKNTEALAWLRERVPAVMENAEVLAWLAEV